VPTHTSLIVGDGNLNRCYTMVVPVQPADETHFRIPVKPKTWLWVTNIVIQPAMAALFFWMVMNADGVTTMIFGAVMGFITLGLFVLSLVVVVRTLGKTFEIVATANVLSVPNLVTGNVADVEYANIRRAIVTETHTSGTTFSALRIEFAVRNQAKSVTLNSQFIGDEAFGRVRSYLQQRGVQIE
jgi:hypothetical protein